MKNCLIDKSPCEFLKENEEKFFAKSIFSQLLTQNVIGKGTLFEL